MNNQIIKNRQIIQYQKILKVHSKYVLIIYFMSGEDTEQNTSNNLADSYKDSVISQQAIPQDNLLDVRDKSHRFDDLDNIKIWGYGVGHFINDLVAACWFNYLFFFLKRVVKTPAASSALLSGQICDGVATPVVGYLSDKFSTRFGQRTPWYVGGLILVIICYLPIYQSFHSENKTNEYIYYTIFPGIFNFGWASLQISHMSLVPSLTCSRKRRDKLNNLRNSFTFIANFVVLGMGSLIFYFMDSPALEYSIISYVVASVGTVASIFFLYHVREVPLTQACKQKAKKLKDQIQQQKKIELSKNSNIQFSEDSDGLQGVHVSNRLNKVESITQWFKMPKFYLFGICYMGVRLCTNMFGTLLPFYLIGVLNLGLADESDNSVPFTVALVPLIVYFSSVLASLRLNYFYKRFGRKMALTVGTIISGVALCSLFFLTPDSGWVVYIMAVFIGCSQTMILATGINFISDVVGTKAKTGAFVFGIYSLLDKFSAGAVMFVIGNTDAYTKQPKDLTNSQKDFIKYTTILIPALSAVLATLIVISYPIQEYKEAKKHKKNYQSFRKNSIQQELVM